MLNISVKLFATLRENRGKVVSLSVLPKTKVRDILAQLDIDQKDVSIILINGKDGELDDEIPNEATLSLFPPVGGG